MPTNACFSGLFCMMVALACIVCKCVNMWQTGVRTPILKSSAEGCQSAGFQIVAPLAHAAVSSDASPADTPLANTFAPLASNATADT